MSTQTEKTLSNPIKNNMLAFQNLFNNSISITQHPPVSFSSLTELLQKYEKAVQFQQCDSSPIRSLSLWSVCVSGGLFRTVLLRGIHHDRWEHLQTLSLSLELLHLLLLHLHPSAEQIHRQVFLTHTVKTHHQTVWTGCVHKGYGDVKLLDVEAAVFY